MNLGDLPFCPPNSSWLIRGEKLFPRQMVFGIFHPVKLPIPWENIPRRHSPTRSKNCHNSFTLCM